jgi:hypothetical protein
MSSTVETAIEIRPVATDVVHSMAERAASITEVEGSPRDHDLAASGRNRRDPGGCRFLGAGGHHLGRRALRLLPHRMSSDAVLDVGGAA